MGDAAVDFDILSFSKKVVTQAKNEIEKEEIDCRGEIAGDVLSLHLAYYYPQHHGHYVIMKHLVGMSVQPRIPLDALHIFFH